MPVSVQHDITDDQYACLLKGGYMYLHCRQYWFNLIKTHFSHGIHGRTRKYDF